MLRNEDVEAVKVAVNMVELAGQYGLKVNRNGFALCPFHQDKHPSMKVFDGYLTKDGYRCYSCGAHGDIIHFVRRYEGLDFEAAVRRIAGMFNVPISGGGKLSDQDRKKIADRKAKLERERKRKQANQRAMMRLAEEIHWNDWLLTQVIPFGGMFRHLANRRPVLVGEWERRYESTGKKQARASDATGGKKPK